MSKWIQKTVIPKLGAGTSLAVAFTPAAAGNVLLLAAASGSVLGDPSGWTLVRSAVKDSALSLWTKTATAGESTVTIPVNTAGWSVMAVVYEFPPGTSVLAAAEQTDHAVGGVAVTGLTGLAATAKLLMHFAAIPGDSPALPTLGSLTWAGGVVTDEYEAIAGGAAGDAQSMFVGYLEDSTATSWAPTNYLSGDAGLHYRSERVTVAFTVGAAPEPEPLDTPEVTASHTDPTTPGGTDGTITVTWAPVPNAARYEVGIATGHDQTTGFTQVAADASSPHIITGRAAGNYTVAVKAHP